MVEACSDRIAPMQKQFPKYIPKQIHRNTPFKFNMEQIEMRINQIQYRIYPQWRLALQYYLQAFEEIAVVEGNWQYSLFWGEEIED